VDIGIHVAKVINVGGVEIWITETMINTWIICGVLILFAFIINRSIKNPKRVPTGIQNVVELIVGSLDSFVESTMGKYAKRFSTFYGGMFLFLIVSNLSGLFIGPGTRFYGMSDGTWFGFMRPPTADIATTFALALITFFMTQGFGIYAKGLKGWGKGLTEPMWPLTPLNVIGELANPISLSFRLFGNILGGTIIMGLYYNLPWYLMLGIPSALHAYFDLFAGVLQAFIFVMLSMTFVSSAMDE